MSDSQESLQKKYGDSGNCPNCGEELSYSYEDKTKHLSKHCRSCNFHENVSCNLCGSIGLHGAKFCRYCGNELKAIISTKKEEKK